MPDCLECLIACEHLLDWASVVLIWQEEHMKLAKMIVNGANPISDEDEARIRKVLQRGSPPKGDIWSYERGLA